jgi:N-methylhydantoinase A
MVAFGGAGPLHAARLARAVGIPGVIVPYGAGVGSAIGLLEADPRIDVTITKVMRLDAEARGADIAALYRDLEARARDAARRIAPDGEPTWSRTAQMRYAGQGFEIHVELPPSAIDADYAARAVAAFNQAYLGKHKFLDPEGVVEVVDWTLVATIPSRNRKAALLGCAAGKSAEGCRSTRRAWFPEAGGFVDTQVVDRACLAAAGGIAGPAIVQDRDSTAVILPGDSAHISPRGHLIIDIAREALP